MNYLKNKIVKIGILIAVSIVLNILERYFVLPVPFVKIGLSYIVILIGLYLFGIKISIIVAISKVIVASVFFGYFLSPVFFISLAGNFGAVISMALFLKLFNKKFSIIGISVIGAVTFNIVQVFFSYMLFIKQNQIFSFLPVIIILSLLTGFFIGIISLITLEKLNLEIS